MFLKTNNPLFCKVCCKVKNTKRLLKNEKLFLYKNHFLVRVDENQCGHLEGCMTCFTEAIKKESKTFNVNHVENESLDTWVFEPIPENKVIVGVRHAVFERATRTRDWLKTIRKKHEQSNHFWKLGKRSQDVSEIGGG